MPRVEHREVVAIIDTTLTDVHPFIDTANIIVTDKLSSIHDDTLLKEIEKWLAAHFVAIRDRRPQSETLGNASVTYQGQTGLGLDATLYGQQVKVLDTSGVLASMGKRIAEVKALG